MAKTGLSQSFYAIYSVSGGVVSYSDGATLGKAVEADIAPSDSSDNIFYANNGPAESASDFTGGTLTITNDTLPLTHAAALLGLTVETVATPAGSAVKFLSGATRPYVGYGTVIRSMVNGATSWMAVILPKVQFQTPTDNASTQGENIEFSGHELTATILRDDTANQVWKILGEFSTEADAVTYIKTFLNIT